MSPYGVPLPLWWYTDEDRLRRAREERERSRDDFDPCPMGCGRTTDDAAGGPCSDCWDDAPESSS